MTAPHSGDFLIPDKLGQLVAHINLCSDRTIPVLNLSPLSFTTALTLAACRPGLLPTTGRILFYRDLAPGSGLVNSLPGLPQPQEAHLPLGSPYKSLLMTQKKHLAFSSDFFFMACYCSYTFLLFSHSWTPFTSKLPWPTAMLNLFLNY